MPRKEPELLSLANAAKIANRNPSTLRHAIDRGVLKAEKVGAYWIVTREELERWMKSPAYNENMRRR